MKKFFIVLLTICMAFCVSVFGACGNGNGDGGGGGRDPGWTKPF